MSFKRDILKVTGLAAVLSAAFTTNAMAVDVSGAGATFPYAVYTSWAVAYKEATGNTVNYQGIGSSGGIKQIKAHTVDFGATDAPLKADDLEKSGLVQFPAVMGAAVFVVNLKGFKTGEIRLDGPTVAAIMDARITKWNDARITALNPGKEMPSTAITVVHRSDGSGTTYLVTNYLARESEAFKTEVGAGKSVNWPATTIGGKGNPGVAANVKKINGAVGYVDYADAVKGGLPMVALKNKDGNFITPNLDAFKAAAAKADFAHAAGLAPDLINQAGENAWPMVTATYILLHEKADDMTKSKGVMDFYAWAYANGADMAGKLSFVALPQNVVGLIKEEWKRVK